MHLVALTYLMTLDSEDHIATCANLFANATSMTDLTAALRCLVTMDYTDCDEIANNALQEFYAKWEHDNQAKNVWFQVQALAQSKNTIENLRRLMNSSAFDINIPNHVYAVVRTFATMNLSQFHRNDGAGYKFVIDAVIKVDPINPSVAARVMLTLFNDWHKFDTTRQKLMLSELRRLAAVSSLSQQTRDLVTKKLANAPAVEFAVEQQPYEFELLPPTQPMMDVEAFEDEESTPPPVIHQYRTDSPPKRSRSDSEQASAGYYETVSDGDEEVVTANPGLRL